MRIKRLAVAGVGRFAGEAVVEGFGPGVNVLAAPNEAGKSTLFRALRTCVFERHKSKNKDIEALRTAGVSVPASITLDFESEGHDYRIAKTFLRGAGASLSRDGCEIAKGAAADETLWEILGIEPLSRSIDQAAYAMLWVGQRASFDLPEITKAGETALGTAIETEVGAMVGSERAKAILAETRSELGKYVTEKTGKAAVQGPLAQAQRDLEQHRQDLALHSERLHQLEEQFARLESLRSELARLSDATEVAQREEELKSAKVELQAARQAADRLIGIETEERRCNASLDAAQGKLHQLKARAQAIGEARQRDAVLAKEIAGFADETQRLREQVAALRNELAQIDVADETDTARDRLLAQLARAAEMLQAKSEIERKVAVLQGIMDLRRTAGAELAAIKVTAKHLRTLEETERELSLIDARLDATAARLTIKLHAAAKAAVSVSGRPAQDNETFAITEAISVSVGDIATLVVAPPDGFGKDHEKARKGFADKRRKLLADIGCASLVELRDALARREERERQLKAIDAELAVFGIAPDGCEEALASMLNGVAVMSAEIAEAMTLAGVEAPPERGTIEEERREISARLDARRRARKTLEASVREPQQMLEQASAARDRRMGEQDALRKTLAAHLAALPDEGRDAAIAAAMAEVDGARAAHQQAAGALADIRARTPSVEEIERLAHKLARLEQAATNRRDRLAELERTISNLEGQIQSAGGDGLGERVAALESQLAHLDTEVRRHAKRVAILTLLADTIGTALDDNRNRFYAPVLQRMKPFLNDVFPGAALELDDGFQVSGLSRGGNEAEQFDQLSDGTQEQIAVLARLGLGALLAEKGRAAPIILDDALVFSDDDRIARMFDALMRAGANQQIIVLTCRMRAFEALGGQALHITHS
jgi:DNA repair exonuclease SbcCD ATPase subunit